MNARTQQLSEDTLADDNDRLRKQINDALDADSSPAPSPMRTPWRVSDDMPYRLADDDSVDAQLRTDSMRAYTPPPTPSVSGRTKWFRVALAAVAFAAIVWVLSRA